ncbi:cwf15/Cwc15 cell cycle control domain-containing protein [Rhizoctonia solani AG-1 IA]|uniref:Cwf15/Cwc15 cell cycle control domain-containing protein n=1 Tax=Thanatephorus cucumeris (strain AG1-IA) TaxID=983506 RepID=L8WV79_THACA|nr:cwf15/Cwc15 cell cycle control domain-containing protein [Rhizoctonia solani AG-1 IA]
MSTAHRPTWDPAQAKDVKSGSRQYSSRDMASQTKLKFRQPGQTSVGDVKKRDLRTDLLLAEHEAKNKKRKAAGQDPLPLPPALAALTSNATPVAAIENGPSEEEDPASKRQKMLQEALELDRDDDDDDAKVDVDDDDDDDEDEDSDDDEDETAQLLAELERIKRERAAEEERKAREVSEGKARDLEEEIATRNPLLNLEAALGQGSKSGKPGTFAVKKRWDDGEDPFLLRQSIPRNLSTLRQMLSLKTRPLTHQTPRTDSLSTTCCVRNSIG